MRRLLVATTLAVGLVVAAPAAPAAPADAGAEAQFVSLTNSLRASQGLPAYEVHDNLVGKARGWAQAMANAGTISHSHLPDGVTVDWQRLGENVGMGPSVQSIHDALVNSPGHYANLMDPGFRYIGVGVVNANGTIFVAEVFMEPASQPAPSAPAPAAGTPTSTPEPAPAPAAAAASPQPAPLPPPPPPEPEPMPTSPRLVLALERLEAFLD